MTSLAFDIPQASDQPDHRDLRRAVSVLDVLRHPVLDVLNLDTTPATTCGNGPLAGNSRPSGPFLLCPVMCHLVALRTAVSRCPRTYSGRRPAARTVGVHRRLSTDGHGRAAPAAYSGLTGGACGRFGDRADGVSALSYPRRAQRCVPCPLGTPGSMSFRTRPSWRRPAPHGATSSRRRQAETAHGLSAVNGIGGVADFNGPQYLLGG